MSYAIAAYAITAVALLGYAASLLREHARLARSGDRD